MRLFSVSLIRSRSSFAVPQYRMRFTSVTVSLLHCLTVIGYLFTADWLSIHC